MLSATLVEDDFALAPLAPLSLGDEGDKVADLGKVLAVVAIVGIFVGAAVLQAWSYNWDWKCLVAQCMRTMPSGK